MRQQLEDLETVGTAQRFSHARKLGVQATLEFAVGVGSSHSHVFNRTLEYLQSSSFCQRGVSRAAWLFGRARLGSARRAMLGLLPLVLLPGQGGELERPLAIVMIGGVVTSVSSALWPLQSF